MQCSAEEKSKSNTIQRWRIWPWERRECTSINPKVIEYNLSELTWWFLFFTFDIKVYLFPDNWGHSWGREFKDLKYTHMHTHPQIIFYIAVVFNIFDSHLILNPEEILFCNPMIHLQFEIFQLKIFTHPRYPLQVHYILQFSFFSSTWISLGICFQNFAL